MIVFSVSMEVARVNDDDYSGKKNLGVYSSILQVEVILDMVREDG